MNSKKLVGTLAVCAALVGGVGALAAPAQAEIPLEAPTADVAGESGSGSGSATYSADGAELLVCLLKGSFTGSKAPLC
ncbi:hypothetical protein [Nocardia sp. NPDC050406]|uniref:hypothetical protein n=1 Tax=Nocardia sp. NPDC050406 TaxID=3364318 RepID=UPI0037B415D7